MFQAYLAQFISIFIQLFIFAIFARVILSWLRVAPRGIVFNLLVETTEPLLSVFRRIVPPLGGVVDISPLLAFFALDIIRSLILRLLT